jgi:acyl carrier protein
MTPETIVAKVFDSDVADITDATSHETVAAWDSLGHITLLIELEAAYGVSFSAEESLAMTNVAAIKRMLHERGVAW